jgi:Na+/H+ antiporter NhaD/arsenite permease-like protein
MDWQAWYSIAVTMLCFGTLALTRYSPDIVMVGGLTLLLVAGVLSPEQALAGLANEGMVTVGVLYVVVAGLRDTGGIDWIAHSVLGRPRSLRMAQFRLMAPVAAMSAFLNNTPVVAMFIPAVSGWAKRNQLSVSKLMIPLSYAGIAGGTCTLIGTSTWSSMACLSKKPAVTDSRCSNSPGSACQYC